MTHARRFDDELLDDAAQLAEGDAAARARHASHLAGDAEARDLVFELEGTADAVGHAGSDYEPPKDLGARVLAAIDAHRGSAPAFKMPERSVTESGESAKVPTPRARFDAVPERTPKPVVEAPKLTRRSPFVAAGIAFTMAAAVAAGAFVWMNRPTSAPVAAREGWSGTVESAWPDAAGLTIRSARRGAAGAFGAGSVLTTDERTRARLTLADGTQMQLDHGSELAFDAGGRHARLVRGSVLADVAHLEHDQALFATPHGDVQVLGTKLLVTTSDAGTSVRVLRGRVRLASPRGSVEVGAGEEGTAFAGQEPRRMLASIPVAMSFDEDADPDVQGEDAALPGLGELRARRPGETTERERPLTLASHHVEVKMVGPVSRTEIEETFRNDDDVTLEGVYRFPLPAGARIASLALEVDGRWEEGSFVARERAAQIFRGVVHHAIPGGAPQPREELIWVPGPWRDPALLEWKRGGRFELRIFPIAARSERRVRIAYEETVPVDGNARRYTYPLPSVRRGSSTVGDFQIDVRVAGRRPNDVRVSGYPFTVTEDAGASRLHYAASAFAPAGAITVDYQIDDPNAELRAFAFSGQAVAPVPERSRDTEETQAAQRALGADPRPYVTFALRPAMPLNSATQATDYAIVVDSSQSMTGDRFVRARRLVGSLVQELDRRHRVTVIACDLECTQQGELAMPTSETAAKVDSFLADIHPGGSSNLVASLARGASAVRGSRDRRHAVIYVGDGVASAGLTDVASIASETQALGESTGTTFTTVGIGDDADARILAAVARSGGGVHIPFTPGRDNASSALAVLESTYGVALEQATLEMPAGIETVAPAALPTVLPGRELLVSARYTGAVHGEIVLRGKLGGRPYERRYPIALDAAPSATNAFVPRTWAASRIADLELEEGASKESELVALSKGFGVISRSTSLLVLESEAMFRAYGVERTTGQANWDGEDTDEIVATGIGDLGTSASTGHGYGPSASGGTLGGDVMDNPYSDGGGRAGEMFRRAPAAMAAAPEPDTRHRENRASATATPAAPAQVAQPVPMSRPQGPGRWMAVMWVRDASIAQASGPSSRDLTAAMNARAAHQASPDSRDKTRDAVRALARAGLLDEATHEVEAWLGRDPNDVEALVLASDLYAMLGRGDQAARTLSGVVDADPSDASMHERLALAFERQGKSDQACAFRLSLASLRATDEPAQRLASACASRLGFQHAKTSIDTRASTLAHRNDNAVVTGDAERARGELVVEATFGGTDLDVSILTPRGERASLLGGPRGTTASRVSQTFGETVALRSLRSGSYYIDVSRHASGTGPVSGELRIRALGVSRTISFVLQGDHATVARVDMTRRRVLVNR